MVFLLLCSWGNPLFAQHPYANYVDPFIGAEGGGNVFVGPCCPFGMVKPGPDCDEDANSGYVSDQRQPVYGFSQLHVSGTGGGPKYGNISVMPFGGDFDHILQTSLREQETASAGYYSVLLKKWDIRAELTASPKVAFHRYIFNRSGKQGIKIDAGGFLGENHIPGSEAQQFVGSEIEVVSATELRGYSRVRGGWNNGGPYTVYFHIIVNHPFRNFTTWKGDRLYPGVKLQVDSGQKTGALLYFDGSAPGAGERPDTLQLKIGISFISSSKAEKNISGEIPGWDFNGVTERCRQGWESLLKRIEPGASATEDQKKMFYTALYHTMLMPVDRTGENPLWTNDQPYYDDFYCIWDTFRSSQPLITLISPSRQAAIVNALLNIYQHDGYLPEGRSGNFNGRTQGGSNAEVVIADAFVKGLTGIDYPLALKAMLQDATVPPGGNEEQEGRGGLTDYNRKGYVPSGYVRSGSRTVEYSYDDYCIAAVAKGLGYTQEYKRFIKQSNNWQHLWRNYTDHGATGFIMPKDAAGNWVDRIKCDGVDTGAQAGSGPGRPANYMLYTPLAQDWPVCRCWWCGTFYEASSWEYSFYVPHDVAGLIQKAGGKERFVARLDTLFDHGYYNVGNEPSFLSPCLYHWAGRPDLSAARIRDIISHSYTPARNGIPGNDDSGAMSSWLAFHMIGLYPNAGQAYYLITSPYFEQTVIHQENGKDFTIIAKNLSAKNIYIRSAALNGKPFDQAWIEHRDIVNGGVLVLQMGDKPASWGTQVLPPSTAAGGLITARRDLAQKGGASASIRGTSASTRGKPVQVWVSTADGTKKLSREDDVRFHPDGGTDLPYTIGVREDQTCQQWIGCGSCTNDASSWLMFEKLGKAAKDDLMNKLFSKSAGIGMDWVRQQMGGGDAAVIDNGWWTYDDMPKGQADPDLDHFSINMEKGYILPMLRQALRINPGLKIVGCPWTPPGWMKTSANDRNPLNHGYIDPKYYGSFARYFVKFIQAYAKEGLPVYGISLQNEPLADHQPWQACGIPATVERDLVKNYFAPAFNKNGITSKIYVFDHNWDVGWDYVSTVYSDTAAYRAVAGSMWHHYGGLPGRMTEIHDAYPDKEIWFTEGCATTHPINSIYMDYSTYRGSFLNFSYNVINIPRNWCQTVMMYQIAMDPDHGPAVFSPPTNYGMVTIDPANGHITYRPEYYTLGHISKFVNPGALRIASNQYDGRIEDVAFKNPDGSIVLVLSNRTPGAESVKVKWGAQAFTCRIPGESMGTFKWNLKSIF